jgi:hypothetical protein
MYLIAWKTRQEILAGCILRSHYGVVGRFDPKSGCPVTGWMNVPRRWKKERQETGDSCRLRPLPFDMIQIVYVRSQDE